MPALGLALGLPFTRPSGGGFVGPLDNYTTSLKLALLPFRGFASYQDACLRVRDDGDSDAEQDIIFDATGAPVVPTIIGNAGVRYWYDQSGQGNDFAQSTAVVQPYWNEDTLNSYPIIRLDGTNDELQGATTAASSRTIYIVLKKRTAADGTSQVALRGHTTLVQYLLTNNAYGSDWNYYGTPAFGVESVGGVPTDWLIITLKFESSGPTCTPYINGIAGTPFTPQSDYTAGTTSFIGSNGGANFCDVDIAARLDYDAAHDNTTREAIESLLETMFNLTP